MSATLLDELAGLGPAPEDAFRLGIPPGPLELASAWPRGRGRLLLRFTTGDGRSLAGQWLDDRATLRRVGAATVLAAGRERVTLARAGAAEVLLQAGGADRRLPVLGQLVMRPGARLVAHRPERRGVVRLESPGRVAFAKVLRPERARGAAQAARQAAHLVAPAFAVPALLAGSPAAGVVMMSALAGPSLHELLAAGSGEEAAGAVGRALSALHSGRSPAGPPHGAGDEAAVLEGWVDRLEPYAPALVRTLADAAAQVAGGLRSTRTPSTVLLHRDLHDKQLVMSPEGRVGLIDLDTLAAGDPALDLANLLVHFELRGVQGRCTGDEAARAQHALLGEYGGFEDERRLDLYADAARLRLACVYAFRPRWKAVPRSMLARVGHGVIAALADPMTSYTSST